MSSHWNSFSGKYDDEYLDLDFSNNNRIDFIIGKLLEALGNIRTGRRTLIDLDVSDIMFLCSNAQQVLLKDPVLLNLNPPIKIVGDLHGQYLDLLQWFVFTGFPPDESFLFLGDYVDRGYQSIETISLLFAFKVKYPKNVYLLRGNHESAKLNRMYGFYDECRNRYNMRVWNCFVDCFNCLPVAALVGYKIFCVHGGLSPSLSEIDQIRTIERPTEVPDHGVLCDILWSDPGGNNFQGWRPSERGVSYVFGVDVVKEFIANNNIDLICRAHQMVKNGYEFFAGESLVTIFSAPNYCDEANNNASILFVNEELVCSFATMVSNK